MTLLTVKQVAQMARFTERQIQYECKRERLKATKVPVFACPPSWRIEKTDYLAWMAESPTWRRRWNNRRKTKRGKQ